MAKRRPKTPPPPAETVATDQAATDPPVAAPTPPAEAAPAVTAADAIAVQSIALTDRRDGPRVRLFRSHRFRQMQIRFDEKPPEAIRERLHAAGWQWRVADQAWTMQLDPDARWRTHTEAARLLDAIAAEIRHESGWSGPAGGRG